MFTKRIINGLKENVCHLFILWFRPNVPFRVAYQSAYEAYINLQVFSGGTASYMVFSFFSFHPLLISVDKHTQQIHHL